MTDDMIRSIKNAVASSAMEGLPLEHRNIEIIQNILDGKMTLQEYFKQLQETYREA